MGDLSFGVIQEPLNRLCVATGNLLEREYPARLRVDGSDALVTTLFRVAVWDQRAVRHLCDVRLLNYSPKLSVAIPPLARTILDAIFFTIVFLFDDLASNSRWYWRSGWREGCEHFRRRYENRLPTMGRRSTGSGRFRNRRRGVQPRRRSTQADRVASLRNAGPIEGAARRPIDTLLACDLLGSHSSNAAMGGPMPLTGSELLNTLAAAVTVLQGAPIILDAVNASQWSLTGLFRGRSTPSPIGTMAGPLEKVIQNNTKRLEGLLDKARQIDSGDYSELEKDQARFFVARQTCRLLKMCAPIKDRIPDYDTLVEIFCGTALEVLSGSEE